MGFLLGVLDCGFRECEHHERRDLMRETGVKGGGNELVFREWILNRNTSPRATWLGSLRVQRGGDRVIPDAALAL